MQARTWLRTFCHPFGLLWSWSMVGVSPTIAVVERERVTGKHAGQPRTGGGLFDTGRGFQPPSAFFVFSAVRL